MEESTLSLVESMLKDYVYEVCRQVRRRRMMIVVVVLVAMMMMMMMVVVVG